MLSLQRLGKAISLSVERFVTVGETIGEEGSQTSRDQRPLNPPAGAGDGQARKEMLGACRDSRLAGKLVEKLAENLAVQVTRHNTTRQKPVLWFPKWMYQTYFSLSLME